MDNSRVPDFAGVANFPDSNDFPNSNDFKDECMKGLIVPHPAEKCQIKLVAKLGACILSLTANRSAQRGFGTSKRVMV
jgi:hypothetical protein